VRTADQLGIRALTFDVFGTVVDWRTGIAREGARLGQAKGITADWESFADAWRGLYQPTLARVRDGAMEWTKLDDLHRMSLVELLSRFGLDGLSPDEITDLSHAWRRLDPWPDVLPGLTRMRHRFILATLSNGNVALLVEMAKRSGLPWDAILGAEVARSYKPQPAAYLTTADVLSLPPEHCLMVAAHHEDLLAARSCGFRTAYVERPDEYGPGKGKLLPPTTGITSWPTT
jgi:2-haloacid dehalogenase